MAIVHKQSAQNFNNGGAGATPVTLAVTPNNIGNLLVVCVNLNILQAPSIGISDTAGNAWNTLSSQIVNGTSYTMTVWAAANGTSSTTLSITGQGPGHIQFSSILLDEFDMGGAMSASLVDQVNSNNNLNSITTTGNLAVDGELVWVATMDTVTGVGTIGGTTANAGANDTQQDWTEYLILTAGSGATITGVLGNSTSGAQLFIATFKPFVVASSAPPSLFNSTFIPSAVRQRFVSI